MQLGRFFIKFAIACFLIVAGLAFWRQVVADTENRHLPSSAEIRAAAAQIHVGDDAAIVPKVLAQHGLVTTYNDASKSYHAQVIQKGWLFDTNMMIDVLTKEGKVTRVMVNRIGIFL